MPDSNEWARRVTTLRQWQQAGERAPHKPLLLLYAIGRWQRTGSTSVAFVDAKSDLTRLLVEFGPPRPLRPPKPSYLFHHLENDEGLWTVRTDSGIGSPGSGIGQLVKSGAIGSLTPEFIEALSDPQTLGRIVKADYTVNVSQHFIGRSPAGDTLVLANAGKPLVVPQSGQPQPDPSHVLWHTKEVFRSPERTAAIS